MTQEERENLLAIIDRDIDKMRKKILDLKDFTAPVAPDDAIGRVSRMDAINNKSIFEASMRNSQTRLDQLTFIRDKVFVENYGICASCHQSIPYERLKIRPEIRLCATCLQAAP